MSSALGPRYCDCTCLEIRAKYNIAFFPGEVNLDSPCTKALRPELQDSPILLTLMGIAQSWDQHISCQLVPAM